MGIHHRLGFQSLQLDLALYGPLVDENDYMTDLCFKAAVKDIQEKREKAAAAAAAAGSAAPKAAASSG
eukprot:scaffold48028_cov17-Tisochrysis_lutea.AAC.3